MTAGARRDAAPPGIGTGVLQVAVVVGCLFVAIVLALGWWQVIQAGPLTTDPANPLLLAAERTEPRGRIRDWRGTTLALSARADGELRRRYPRPAAEPVIGYRTLRFGRVGLEATYDRQLVGLDQLGPGDELLRKFRFDPHDPSSLWLSIDIRLQELAARLLGEDRGAVVALEPGTGRVLALASSPTFDPNLLVSPTTGQTAMDELRADPSSPLLNRATQGRYPPGSVFKVVTAIAALESGSIVADTRYPDQPGESRNGYRVSGFRIADPPRDVQLDHPLDLYEAMEVSSNVYFAHVVLDTGASALVREASQLGIGRMPAFDLPTATSQVNGGDGPLDGFADDVELASSAFGQGEVLVTPLQMAVVAGAVANDGVLMAPRLVDRLVSRNGGELRLEPQELGRVMSAATAGTVTEAMVRAVEGPFAANYAGGAAVDGVSTAGKSGSAEVGGGRRAHSWFIGFAPADDPAIAVAVVVENAGFGSRRAVPLGGRLMSAWIERFSKPRE
jgi:peptidoglycan glycosyltransferase